MVEELQDLVALFIKCRKLHDNELIGTSDPMVIVSEFIKKTNTWVEVGRTEIAKNNLNPNFQSVDVKYYLEKR